MRIVFLLVALTGFCSCATVERPPVDREEIQQSVERLIAKREQWQGKSHLRISQEADGGWWVEAHELGEKMPDCGCYAFVEGTGRDIRFTPSGKLIRYVRTP